MNSKLLAAIVIGLLSGGIASRPVLAQTGTLQHQETEQLPTYDPWEPFNQKMFWFNLRLDDYVLRPVATGYSKVLPEQARQSVGRFIKNLGVVERLANNLLQGKLPGAGQEIGRFAINTTLGGVGLFDVADQWFGLKESPEDFGQTLAVYGVSAGPYLMLPFYGPSTVRDTVGLAVDGAMNPMNYFLSTVELIAVRGGLTVTNAINYRSLNLQFFEDVDRYAVDLYGAVQDGYLQRREKAIQE
ncbi:MAG TPA: VacJ family lipoprotein [Candidatus Binatia bacterium]|nr:VacJ family lipoprotein [Candidatus Binatia bacterium]